MLERWKNNSFLVHIVSVNSCGLKECERIGKSMRYLINASNLKQGGGVQVADSVCRELHRFPQHRFVVVLSTFFSETLTAIKDYPNVEVCQYDVRNNISTLLLGRDAFLDGLVTEKKIDAVLTIFGPSRWRPRCKHLCGFARAQLLLKNPLQTKQPLKEKLSYRIWEWAFKRSSNLFYTENSYITVMLPQLLGNVKVYTVTNYYNQVFDQSELWNNKSLSPFNGTTLLTLSSAYPHKNLEIAAEIAWILKERHPEFEFRFVFSIDSKQFQANIKGIEEHFVFLGKVDISECPSLYEQCDIAFQPTLMECFTATYPEAMRMDVPIVTTDLEFARGLCGNAACYYSAMDPKAAAEAIYRVATDKKYSKKLVENGKKQLLTYDNYEQRANKLIGLLEGISLNNE